MMAGSMNGLGQAKLWARWAGVGLALFSGVAALALLLLPLLLVLLMVLFDTTAHGLLVLLALLLSWLRQFVPDGQGGLPAFRTVAFHPLDVALGSLTHALPCLAGLAVILINRASRGWWWVALLWGLAAATSGRIVAAVLLPGLVLAALLALPPGVRADR
jgi:hypothetical protein